MFLDITLMNNSLKKSLSNNVSWVQLKFFLIKNITLSATHEFSKAFILKCSYDQRGEKYHRR